MVQLGEHFAKTDQANPSEWDRQQQWFIKARQDNERREKAEERLEDDITALAAEAIIATQAQLAAFEARLDKYDEATVKALMENQIALDAVNERITAMLEQAHVMDDGRRVFKTEDGTQVFDEHGVEVEHVEIHPDTIDNSRPTYEAYVSLTDQRYALQNERTEILEFQEKVDTARELAAEGDISEADLEALDADLLEAMPDTVRAHAGGEPREPMPDVTNAFKASTAIPTLQVQSAEVQTSAPTFN